MAKIEIDGKSLEVEDGIMVIQAADDAGIYIPRFCYHEKLSVSANCRMCMVDVEKAPKPLPACATPVMDGMKIRTRSERAVDAQKGTMEFLLINHPLDCPICDQGGECPLQDQALGYGKDVSRLSEKKRVVPDKDIGPLIETAMTRCIHCTRCIRFGREIAGIMEMGGVGRGENLEIGTALGKSVDSELSGNMIDLCPVGALTSKPFRYSARSWEMKGFPGVSPHDCIGANIEVQTLRNEVKRVVPRSNVDVNDCWISDRDRFGFQAVNSSDRLTTPMLKSGDHWESTDWKTAFNKVAQGLQNVVRSHGVDALGGLISPASTNEEFYLFQKVLRGLGCQNIDHRLRQLDFSDDAGASRFPGSQIILSDVDKLKSILLVGSNVRKEQPLLGLRLRAAGLSGAKIHAVNAMDYRFSFDLAGESVVDPASMPGALARVAASLAQLKDLQLPEEIAKWAETTVQEPVYEQIAESLIGAGEDSLVVLGSSAEQHPRASVLRSVANWIHQNSTARRMDLAQANGAGAWLCGCLPHRGARGKQVEKAGLNARDMIDEPRRAYLLFGLDAMLDSTNGQAVDGALRKSDFVVSFSAFHSDTMNHADVILPISPFTESPGSSVNLNGRVQSYRAAVLPKGESRPGWKVLRVLGNQLGLDGFDYIDVGDIQSEIALSPMEDAPDFVFNPELPMPGAGDSGASGKEFHRILDVPIYRVDALVRRSPALQSTADNMEKPLAGLNPVQLETFGLRQGTLMNIVGPQGDAISIEIYSDSRVPANCIYVPSGYEQTAPLGPAARVALEEV